MVLAYLVGRQHAGTVAGMNACFLNMLHYPGYHHSLAIREGVNIHFHGVLDELVYQHRAFGRGRGSARQKALE